MTDIHPESFWRHKHRGYEIKVEPRGGKVKDGNDANWQPAIHFMRTDEEDGEPYTLSERDFRARFVAVMHDEGDL